MAGERYVLPPEDLPPYDPRVAAQDIANEYLASQGVAGYTPAAAPASTAVPNGSGQSAGPIGPPAPPGGVSPPMPPNGKPSMGSRVMGGLKDAGVLAAGGLLGPAGTFAAGGYVSSKNMPPAPKAEEPAPEGAHAQFGPPTAPGGTEDAPMILNGQGGGGQRMVAPSGMYPHSLSTQVHMGRQVPEEAKRDFGIATAAQLHGADLQSEADRDYYHQVRDLASTKLQANEDAATQHAAIQARRDAMVAERLDQIEGLNAEASASIDPDKFWNDRGAGARVVGAIAVALGQFSANLHGGENGALKVIENGINREISAQLSNRDLAGKKAGHAQNLLSLHLQQLGDQDKAIDATKIALYDNVLTQMDQYAAENKARVSEAALLNAKGAILEKRGELVNKMGLQEQDDVQRTGVDQYRAAQYAQGGGTPAGKMEGYELIPVPASDRTSEKGAMIAVPKDTHKDLSKTVGFTNAVVGINQEALERIKAIKADIELAKSGDLQAVKRIQSNRKLLDDMAQRKASFTSSAEGQGVLKEAEFERAMDDRVLFTDWWKPGVDIEKRLQGQNNSLTGAAGRMVQGVGGQRVKMNYTRDKNGALQPTPLFTGQMYNPAPVGPELLPVQDPKGR